MIALTEVIKNYWRMREFILHRLCGIHIYIYRYMCIIWNQRPSNKCMLVPKWHLSATGFRNTLKHRWADWLAKRKINVKIQLTMSEHRYQYQYLTNNRILCKMLMLWYGCACVCICVCGECRSWRLFIFKAIFICTFYVQKSFSNWSNEVIPFE